MLLSLPARGVWIEISTLEEITLTEFGHSPRGECGLKLNCIDNRLHVGIRHSPRGECGLKYVHILNGATESVTPREGSVD